MQPSLINAVLEIARQAGQLTLAFHPGQGRASRDLQLQHKSDHSPVTQADLIANRHIVDRLAELTPSIPRVSEELPASEAIRRADQRFWLIDPLDGTREFVTGGSDYTVNIALIEQGAPSWGVVYAPALDQLYWGGMATGSFLRAAGQSVRMQVHVPTPLDLAGQSSKVIRVVASKSHMNVATRQFIDRLCGRVELVQAGSSLKLCLIAQGQADVYPRLGDTSEWDTAAAQAVLEGAGGVVTDLQGARLFYGKPDVLNPHFFAASAPLDYWMAR